MPEPRNYLNVSNAWGGEGPFGRPLTPFGAGAAQRGFPGDYTFPSRFVRAAYVNANYPQKEREARQREPHVPFTLPGSDGRGQRDGA